MLENYRMTLQLVTSLVVLSSIDLVSYYHPSTPKTLELSVSTGIPTILVSASVVCDKNQAKFLPA
jgi:hypothetical protein